MTQIRNRAQERVDALMRAASRAEILDQYDRAEELCFQADQLADRYIPDHLSGHAAWVMVCPHGHIEKVVPFFYELGGFFAYNEQDYYCPICGEEMEDTDDKGLVDPRFWGVPSHATR